MTTLKWRPSVYINVTNDTFCCLECSCSPQSRVSCFNWNLTFFRNVITVETSSRLTTAPLTFLMKWLEFASRTFYPQIRSYENLFENKFIRKFKPKNFVRYSCEFIITVIVITEFDCIPFCKWDSESRVNFLDNFWFRRSLVSSIWRHFRMSCTQEFEQRVSSRLSSSTGTSSLICMTWVVNGRREKRSK